jgi:pimeloyl-ACP methyl ester carboxylesterase
MRSILALFLCFSLYAAEPRASFKPYKFEPFNAPAIDAELGEVRVSENRSDPNSRTIALRFVRFKSTAAKPGHPIVYLAGGPGGSGIGAAMGTRFGMFMALREFGDVIAYDQRGINQSAEPKMTCDEPYMSNPAAPMSRASAGAAAAAAVSKCVAKLRAQGVDISAYNTRESAADLDDLRKALGAEKLVLWGISYGAHLSIAALRDHGQHIDKVILAGIEGPDDTYKLPSDQQSLLEEIARLSANETPDLLASMARVLRELETRPKKVTVTHPMNGMTVELALGPLDFQAAVADMLFGPDSFATIADFVTRVDRGDWTALALAAGRLRFSTAPSVMSVAMDCASGITEARRLRIAEEAKKTLLGDAINLPFPEICSAVNVPDAGDAFRADLRSDVPALLISGTLDGRTRPRQAEELRRTMTNATHLIIEGAGHSDPLFLSSPKILEAMKAFLRGEPLKERYITIPPPKFVPVRTPVALSDDVLARYAGEYKIDGKTRRKVVKAGNVLYTIREGNPPFAIRPLNETDFFYENTSGWIRFEADASGKVTGMVFHAPDGTVQRAARM